MPCLARGLLPRVVLVVLGGVAPAAAQTLSLEDAWRLAEQANPALQAARAGRFGAEGLLAEGEALLRNNPTLLYDPSRRTLPQPGGPEQRFREWSAGLSQTFEIAGQQGLRREAARSRSDGLP